MLIVEPMLREYTVDTIYQTTDLDTIYSLLAKRCERDPDDLIAQWQDDETRQWHDVSAGQMSDRVREVAKGLLGLGVKPGSMVVIYAATCYEWGRRGLRLRLHRRGECPRIRDRFAQADG